MSEKKNIEFVLSYSGGKDATLALYRAIKKGYNPKYLMTTYNKDAGRSWFHGLTKEMLETVSDSLEIPIKIIETGLDSDYGKDFEKGLLDLVEEGVNSCVFGDIDIEGHHEWCSERCINTGVKSIFPLWNEDRKDLVHESIDLGFKSVITVVDTSRLSEKFLGKTLTRELIEEICEEGADPCGENGEYHTFCYGGPIFKNEINLKFGEIVKNTNYSAIPIELE